jgi:exo-beta-1,3-glucanase (GH17 family)
MSTIPYHKPGVTYNGLHATTNPTVDQVTADLATTKLHFELVRTYYPQYGGGAVDVGKIAKDVDLKLLLGLFLFDPIRTGPPATTINSSSRRWRAATSRAFLVGNEDPQMIDNGIVPQYLRQVRTDFPQIPVGTSQRSNFWLSDARAEQLVPLVDFVGVNIYPAWDWAHSDVNNQPNGVTPEAGFNSFSATYSQIGLKYPGRQTVVTETGWPTTFGQISSQQFPVGISNARDYLQRVTGWAQAQQVVLYIHNMFDDQYGVDTSSPFNYHFGLIEAAGKPKGILF